jgi:hypothetical protein
MEKSPKVAEKYECKLCDYSCSKKSDFNKHTMTRKHQNRTTRTEKSPKIAENFECECGKVYKARNSLWYHKHRCQYNNVSVNTSNESTLHHQIDSSLVVELLKQNQEFKDIMIEQMNEQSKQNNDFQKQVIELAKNSGNTTNNTINNTTNNRFNLTVFLNETCKDAMNLNDFIQSIELNMNDFINTGEVGYVKGISNIMVERIRDMEPHVRPIHCTDLKRETVYVKDSDKWAKEDDNKTHIRKAVRIVADKNQAQVHPWIKENPNYEILDTPECDKYFEYTKASLGGYGREEDHKFENKIINNILKETVIDKNMIE